jgi:uncharacterized protein (DUF983 family)
MLRIAQPGSGLFDNGFPARNPAKRTPKMSATPGLSRECRFGKSGKLFQPFVTMKPAALSFALSI